ncbi:hypothetical protein Tco_1116077 [Tanacetum coccineum]
MEQYMSKTRANYGSGVSRPKIKDKDNFELKGQFLKELRSNIFSGSDHEDANNTLRNKYYPPSLTAKKMKEINNFQQEPNENLYQAWERFKELLMKCPQHYLMEMQEVPTTPKIAHSRKKGKPSKNGKPSKKLTTLNLVHLFKEGDIEQPFWDSAKGTMQTLHTKKEGNIWKKT